MLVNMIGDLTPIAVSEILKTQLVGKTYAQTPIFCVATDSREVNVGGLFVAIKGERVDGHEYINKAAANGAICALVEHVPQDAPDICYVVVKDTVKALGALAAYIKSSIRPLTVAITGSVGKTTTKEFVYSVLSEKYKTLKTLENHNNNIGMPMTLLELDESYRAAVLEMGMSAYGEISYLSRIGTPDIAIITNIGTSHIENLGSREGIRNAKLEISDGMKEDAILILNGDEPLLAGIDSAYYVSMTGRRAYANVSNIISGENGMAFDITIGGECTESIVIPVLGEHNVLDAAYAFVVGKLLGMSEFDIRRGLMNFKSVGLRQKVTKVSGNTLIEDCYNASPESMRASITLLSKMAKRYGAQSCAVLGEMRELGSYSESGHRSVGAFLAEQNINKVFTFGSLARMIADEAIKCGADSKCVFCVDDLGDYETLAQKICDNVLENDVILFKASRAVALENAVEIVKKKISER